MRHHLTFLAIFLALAPSAYAQELSGINSVMIVAELGDESFARACGVSVASVDAAMRIPVSNSRLRSVKVSTDAILYANVNVVQAPNGQCAAAITVEVTRHLFLKPHEGSPRVFGTVWSNSYTLIGFPQGFGKATSDKVEDYTKQMIAAWLKDR